MPISSEQIGHLLLKKISGELTPGEQLLLEQWSNTSELHRQQVNEIANRHRLQDEFQLFSEAQRRAQEASVPEWHTLSTTASLPVTSTHRIHFLKTTWFRYAAAIIIMITGTAIWYAQHNHSKSFNPLNPSSRQAAAIEPGHNRAILTLANGRQILLDSTQGSIVQQGSLTVVNLAGKLKYEGEGTTTEYNTISTPKGGQYQIVLPDGSKVWLNAASSIKFPTAFTSSERKVEMTGEAYMEIARNPRQSFIVKANGTEIQVLGTSFNVNAYEDESVVRTTLISGSVKVKTIKEEAVLKPGEQSSYNPLIQRILIQTTDIEQALAWKNGVFQVSHTSLAETMRQLARWYDIEVVYEKGVPDIKLWGEIKRDLTLSQLLDVLSGWGVKFRMEAKRLIILQ